MLLVGQYLILLVWWGENRKRASESTDVVLEYLLVVRVAVNLHSVSSYCSRVPTPPPTATLYLESTLAGTPLDKLVPGVSTIYVINMISSSDVIINGLINITPNEAWRLHGAYCKLVIRTVPRRHVLGLPGFDQYVTGASLCGILLYK